MIALWLEVEQVSRYGRGGVVRLVPAEFERDERVGRGRVLAAGSLPRQEVLLVGGQKLDDVLGLTFDELLRNREAADSRG